MFDSVRPLSRSSSSFDLKSSGPQRTRSLSDVTSSHSSAPPKSTTEVSPRRGSFTVGMKAPKTPEVRPDVIPSEKTKLIAMRLKAVPISEMSSEKKASLVSYSQEINDRVTDTTFGQLIESDPGIKSIEKDLRATWRKKASTISKLHEKAETIGQRLVEDSEDSEALIAKLKSLPPHKAKEQIARSVGLMRTDRKLGLDGWTPTLKTVQKYKGQSSYFQLSDNKQALVDSIYRGMMKTTVKPLGGLEVPPDSVVKTVKDSALAYPDKSGEATQTFTKVDKELFSQHISSRDIKQGCLGDCYVLAGLYAVTDSKPEFIQDMMRDNGDGTITVRLYGPKEDSEELEAKYYTFDKSVRDGDARAYDSELWVQMFEKAYAIHNNQSYKSMEGGDVTKVMSHILGVKGTRTPLPMMTEKVNRVSDSVSDLPAYMLLPDQIQQLTDKYHLTGDQVQQLKEASDKDALSGIKVSIKSIWKWPQFAKQEGDSPEILKEKAALATAFDKEVTEMADNLPRIPAIKELLAKSPTHESTKAYVNHTQQEVRQIMSELEDFASSHESFTDSKGVSHTTADLIAVMKEYFGKERVMESFVSVEEPQYTQNQLETFDKIETALSEGKFVGLGSRDSIGVSQGKGHSGGESKVDGLAGKHAYAVLGTAKVEGKIFVRVANPWGSDFARSYDMVGERLERRTYDSSQLDSPFPVNESWVDLNDLFFTFGAVAITD